MMRLLLMALLSVTCLVARAQDGEVVQAAAALGVEALALAQAVQVTGASVQKIANALRHDESARMTKAGGLNYRCRFHDHNAEAEDAESPIVAAANEMNPAGNDSTAVLGDVFKLHSRSTATRKIFLQFQGCITKGTAWNTAENSQGANGTEEIVTPNYDMDGDPSTFSDQERKDIFNIWVAVSEDFALWDVDVTTEDPGPAGIDREHSADVSYGTRVCIGGEAAAWMADVPEGTDARFQPLGVAFVGVFGRINPRELEFIEYIYRDAFVFSGVTTSVKAIWEACSHESGHTLGLMHDGVYGFLPNGTKTYFNYFAGTEIWGPIMGYPHSSQFSHWSDGTYPVGYESKEKQDDLAVMSDTSLARLPRLIDEAGDTEDTGLQLCISSTCSIPDSTTQLVSTTIKAIANSGQDRDYYVFAASGPGRLNIAIDYPTNYRREVSGGQYYHTFRRGNLRLRLAFQQPDVLIEQQQPDDVFTTQSVFAATLPSAGNYSFFLEPTADLGGGYSLPTNYGNVGDYALTVEFPGFPAGQTPILIDSKNDGLQGHPSSPGGGGIAADCNLFTDCNPGDMCTDCMCNSSPACICNAAEGFTPGIVNSLPRCLWALSWSKIPTYFGYFKAKANTRVQLPWRLQAGQVRGCPAAGKAVVQAKSGIVIGSNLIPCPSGTPKVLKAASSVQSLSQQSCKDGSGFTVFVVNQTAVAASELKRCRPLFVKTSDGRKYRGAIWVSK